MPAHYLLAMAAAPRADHRRRDLLIAVAYLAAMGTIGMYVASRRLGRSLLK